MTKIGIRPKQRPRPPRSFLTGRGRSFYTYVAAQQSCLEIRVLGNAFSLLK
jgi:hypothetical protein